MLFILAVETMADRIRKNDRIKGVPFGNTGIQTDLKIMQYADDTSIFFREESSVKYILEELDRFGSVAGPVLNKDETILKWLGPTKHERNFQAFGLYCTDGSINQSL